MKVNNYTKVTIANLKELYYNPKGNLYFRIPLLNKEKYEVCEGFDFSDLYKSLIYDECELIYIEGPSLGTNVEVSKW